MDKSEKFRLNFFKTAIFDKAPLMTALSNVLVSGSNSVVET